MKTPFSAGFESGSSMHDEMLQRLFGVNRDGLADSLKTACAGIIKATDDWRPLADYVAALIYLAELKAKNEG